MDAIYQTSYIGPGSNMKAINFFKSKKYSEAIEIFDKAYNLSPSNVNICLNFVQSLLKQAQINKGSNDMIQKSDKMLSNMPKLAFSDSRYARFSELDRLTQIMLQKK